LLPESSKLVTMPLTGRSGHESSKLVTMPLTGTNGHEKFMFELI